MGRDIDMLEKIGCGFVFATLAMIVAAMIEEYRVNESPSACNYLDAGCEDNMTPCRYTYYTYYCHLNFILNSNTQLIHYIPSTNSIGVLMITMATSIKSGMPVMMWMNLQIVIKHVIQLILMVY